MLYNLKNWNVLPLIVGLVFSLSACSGSDSDNSASAQGGSDSNVTSKAKTVKKLKPKKRMSAEKGRQYLVENGYTVDQEGYRRAVDLLDVKAVEAFLAAGVTPRQSADALAYPAKGTSRYLVPKLPGFLVRNVSSEPFQDIVTAMMAYGFQPPQGTRGNSGGYNYLTSIWAESLRIPNNDAFLDLLMRGQGDWLADPACFKNTQPDCHPDASLPGWLFYMPGNRYEGNLWSLDEAFTAYNALKQRVPETGTINGAPDPFLQASIAYEKFLWAPDDERVNALWESLGKPLPIMPYGKRSELTDPSRQKVFMKSGIYRDYLSRSVFPCIEAKGYEACVNTPPS